jgi:hypothetical protein
MVREDEDSCLWSFCTQGRGPSDPCAVQEVAVAPISCNENARRLGSDEKMLVIEGCGHPEAGCRLDLVFRRAIVLKRAKPVGNGGGNSMIDVEADRHNQAGGSLAARCPSIAVRASVAAVEKNRRLDSLHGQVVVTRDHLNALTGAMLIMPDERPDGRVKIFDTPGTGPRALRIPLDVLRDTRLALCIRQIIVPMRRNHITAPADDSVPGRQENHTTRVVCITI